MIRSKKKGTGAGINIIVANSGTNKQEGDGGTGITRKRMQQRKWRTGRMLKGRQERGRADMSM
jgi:hypothetical protein